MVAQPQNDRITTFANREYSTFAIEHRIYCVPVDEVCYRRPSCWSPTSALTSFFAHRSGISHLWVKSADEGFQQEEERQDEFSKILRERLGGTTLVPFPPSDDDEPAVLDCGFGKGAWIDELLSAHDDCDVTGVDLFLGEESSDDSSGDESSGEDDDDDGGVQEFVKKRWNLNAPFAQDRSETRLRPESFDLINSRCLADGINQDRWPVLIGELKRLLKPRARIQMVEPYFCFQSDNGRLGEAPALNAWWRCYKQYMERINRDPQVGMNLERHMRAQGLERINSAAHRLPIGRWDSARVSLGLDIRQNVSRLLRSFPFPFLRILGMPVETYRSLIERADADLHKEELRLYFSAYVVTARRAQDRR